jgi:tetratricopeptide (TPR) repeat protein
VRQWVPALAASLLAACAVAPRPDAGITPVAPTAAAADATPALLPLPAGTWPVDQQGLRTTAGAIYLHNLDARIDTLAARVAESGLLADREKLASGLWHRFRVRGNLADAERVLAMVEDPAGGFAESPRGQFLRAVVLAGFHRFKEAEAALIDAETRGYAEDEVSRQRADLLVALGRYERLEEDFRRSMELVGDFDTLAHRADLRLLKGDLPGAEKQFWAAQSLYGDINPVPLAWLHTQMGIGFLRFGHVERAAEFFAAAVERLPGYYLAEEHLAECEFLLGRHDAARERYLRVIDATGQPEFMAALAEVESARGDAAAAADWNRRADREFRRLVDRHGMAFSQHAAEFFLAQGDVETARRLADDNLALRQDAGSWMLSAEVALAEGEQLTACDALARVRSTGMSPPELADLESRSGACEPAASGARRGR